MTTLTEAKKRQSNLPPLREVPTGLGKRNHWPKSGPTSSFVKQLHLIRESYFQVTNCSFVDRIGCDENAHWLSSQQGPLTSSPPHNRNPIRHLGVKNQSYPVDFCLSEWECLPFWLPWLGRWLAGWLACFRRRRWPKLPHAHGLLPVLMSASSPLPLPLSALPRPTHAAAARGGVPSSAIKLSRTRPHGLGFHPGIFKSQPF